MASSFQETRIENERRNVLFTFSKTILSRDSVRKKEREREKKFTRVAFAPSQKNKKMLLMM